MQPQDSTPVPMKIESWLQHLQNEVDYLRGARHRFSGKDNAVVELHAAHIIHVGILQVSGVG